MIPTLRIPANCPRVYPRLFVADPFGHRWGIATHLEDVADDEMARPVSELIRPAHA